MPDLQDLRSDRARQWSAALWDGLIEAVAARFAPLEEQLDIQRAVTDQILARGLQVIEDGIGPSITLAQAEAALATVTREALEDMLASWETQGLPAAQVIESAARRFLSDSEIADLEARQTAAQVANAIDAAIITLKGGVGAALDTLDELAAALGDDASFTATVTTALAARLRFDAAQTLTSGQKTQGLTNLGALPRPTAATTVGKILRSTDTGGNQGESALSVDASGNLTSLASINGGPLAGFRNRIINGGMDIAQRATLVTNVTTVGIHTVDRWYTGRFGSSTAHSARRDTETLYGSQNRLTIYSPLSVNDGLSVNTRLTAGMVSDLVGKTVTLSFYAAAAPSAGSVFVRPSVGYPTAANNFAAVTIPNTFADTTLSPAATRDSFTFVLNANHDKGMHLNFDFIQVGAASTSTAVGFGGVQLEIGPVATPFEYRPFGLEEKLCQRFYEKVDVPLVQSPASGVGITMPVMWKVTKRAVPTLSLIGTPVYSGSSNLNLLESTLDGFALQFTATSPGGYIDGIVVAANSEL